MSIRHRGSADVPGADTGAGSSGESFNVTTSTLRSPAASIKKSCEPPPESEMHVRRRTWIIASFWALVLFLGLPLWWRVTTLYRADLPIDEMMEWADGRACQVFFPLHISMRADELSEPESLNLLQLTQHALDGRNTLPSHQLRLQSYGAHNEREDTALALTVRLVPGETESAYLHSSSLTLEVTYRADSISASATPKSTLAEYIANELQSILAEEQAVISYLLSSQSGQQQQQQQQQITSLTPALADSIAKRTTRSLRYSPTYHLTFSLFTSGATPSDWDIEGAIDEYMRPLLRVLSPIHNFTIDTQIQLYSSPGVQSEILRKEDLSSFINAAEWPLSPSIGGAPTINFVVFVGNQTIDLSTHDSGDANRGSPNGDIDTSHSWLIPQWGTVYLLPPASSAASEVMAREHLKAPMLTFTTHLLSLLGTPTTGSLPLRLTTLARYHSADLLLRASSTLGSLARLTLALPSIAIPPTVAEGVDTTMTHLRTACDAMRASHDPVRKVLYHARKAEEEAERVFFEKSMVGQLYFPDEHKVAVYLPLLGPVGVPLIMGLISELKAWKRRRTGR